MYLALRSLGGVSVAGPATDLGFLLHKNPANVHQASLGFGEAYVFYPEANEDRCTAVLLLEVNPVELVRGKKDGKKDGKSGGGITLEDYVNDRPYAATSFLSVAMGRVFGTALSGRSQKREELVNERFRLEAEFAALPVRGGAAILEKLFAPLGYSIEAESLPLDTKFPEWGLSRYCRATLKTEATVHDFLSHLYVLLPVLDEDKHYYVGRDEVEKLLRHGEGWLAQHPEKELIVHRYLQRKRSLTNEALERLTGEDEGPEEESETQEEKLERPISLHQQRLDKVLDSLRALGARRVVDLGCGEGKLLLPLAKESQIEAILGMDVASRSLTIARDRIDRSHLAPRQKDKIQLIQGSVLYRDRRLQGFDAATIVEVIEHLDGPRLRAFERTVFSEAAPRHVILTTPNRDFNANFPGLADGTLRHRDHRFEWTREEFAAWTQHIVATYPYTVTFDQIGPADEQLGAPTQMAIFTREGA